MGGVYIEGFQKESGKWRKVNSSQGKEYFLTHSLFQFGNKEFLGGLGYLVGGCNVLGRFTYIFDCTEKGFKRFWSRLENFKRVLVQHIGGKRGVSQRFT